MCNVQSIDGLDKESQCDEIVKRVVIQLMTPGSIKVLADNISKGIYGETNAQEAEFLYGLLDNSVSIQPLFCRYESKQSFRAVL